MYVRKAAVSGYFYPEDKEELNSLTNQLLNEFDKENIKADPKALIVPHAGYAYSGRVAASAYHMLTKSLQTIKKIILLGPSHRVPVKGIALSSADCFETPMGNISVDTQLRNKLVQDPGIFVQDEAHKAEHSLEVQLPFLQKIFGNEVQILPALTNRASPYQIVDFLEKIWGDMETRIVVSSDLSHYLGYDEAKRKDRYTSDAIIHFDIEHLHDDDACGLIGIKGLLMAAQQKTLTPECILLSNSGDSSGDKSKVVGYGSFCFI
ncbi:MAG: AmmeMemoRadiSam system protein B [Spirochaetia bacterium]|nr:AmmeMemoRadiSam system protein B [Spirochaetia bacterium]